MIIEFKIEGMDCARCISKIESAVRALPGVEAAKVSLIDNSALVKLNPARTSQDTVFKAVESVGYNVSR